MITFKGNAKSNGTTGAILLLGMLFTVSSVLVAEPQQNLQQQQMPPQEEIQVTDDELETFAEVAQKVDSINQEANQQMAAEVQKRDMDVQQFNQLMEELQAAESVEEVNADQATVDRAMAAATEIRDISEETDQKVNNAIQNEGMSPSRYDTIMQLVNSDPQLGQRFQEIWQNR